LEPIHRAIAIYTGAAQGETSITALQQPTSRVEGLFLATPPIATSRYLPFVPDRPLGNHVKILTATSGPSV
jgi:hypothetical protein